MNSDSEECVRNHHDVEDDSETPDVVCRTLVRDALQDLRRSVRRTAAVRTTQLIRLLWPREPEVRQLDVVLDIEKDVLAFQVPPKPRMHSDKFILAF